MKEAFISYSRKNKAFVQQLTAAFEAQQRGVWVDWEKIPLGAQWWDEIETGIEESNAFIFVISPDSITSKVCQTELKYAVSHNKRLIPISYQEVSEKIPAELAQLNWIFFRDQEDFPQSFANLLQTLDTDLDFVKTHTRLLVRAKEWQEHDFDNSFLLHGTDLSVAEQWLDNHRAEQTPEPTHLHTRYIIHSRRLQAKSQRRQFLLMAFSLLIAIVLVISVNYHRQREANAHYQALINEINTLTALTHARLKTDDQLGALLASVKAGKEIQSKHFNKKNDPQLLPLRNDVTRSLVEAIQNTHEFNRLELHSDKVRAVVFSPDNRYLVSASSDFGVVVWRPNGQKLYRRQHRESVTTVDISADSRYFISGSRDKKVKFWQLDTGQLQRVFQHHSQIYDVKFSPDQRLIAVADENGWVHLWHTSGTLHRKFLAHNNSVQRVAFSPDGQTLATVGADRLVKLWSVNTGQCLYSLRGHTDRIYGVAFDPTGEVLATSSADTTVRLWDLRAQPPQLLNADTLYYQNNWVFDVKFNNAGTMLASANANGEIRIWSRDGTLLKLFKNPKTQVMQIAFDPEDKTLASANSDNRIRLYHLDAGNVVKIIEGHTSGLKDLDFSATGDFLATTGSDATVRLWRRHNGNYTLARTIKMGVSVRDVDFLPHSNEMVAVGYDNKLRFMAADGTVTKVIAQKTTQSKSISVAPNGVMVSANNDALQFWSATGEAQQKIEQAHERTVNSVVFSHGGQYLASGGADNAVKLWDNTGRLLFELKGHKDWVNNLSFSPDDRYLASASSDNTIKLWHTSTGQLAKTLLGHSDWVWDVNFSPNQQSPLLVSGGSDNTVRIWDYRQGKLLLTLNQHSGWVRAVSFSPEGDEIGSASADERVIIWQLKALKTELLRRNSSLNQILSRGCALLHDYLATNPKLSAQDKRLCQNPD